MRSMNVSSAPGPDGLPLGFYKTFFNVLRHPLLEMVNNFLAQRHEPVVFNEGRVLLLLKPGGEASDPKAYRPICLLNTDYKLVTTILARRIGETLPHVVSQAEVCSVPGRTITTALSLTRDLFTFASRTGISSFFLSLD